MPKFHLHSMGLPLLSALLSCHVMLSFVFCYVQGSYDYRVTSYKTLTYTKKIMNPIDACWRFDARSASSCRKLADCVVGFDKSALGGKYSAIYTVTDPSDDPVYLKPGTLRYGVIQSKPLWIIFKSDMVIKLKNELMVNSNKMIDGRGAKVEIAMTAPAGGWGVRDLEAHAGIRGGSDGDAITCDIWSLLYSGTCPHISDLNEFCWSTNSSMDCQWCETLVER